MKQTTREILDIINGEVLNNRNEYINIAKEIGIADNPVRDENFTDFLTKLTLSINVIREAANQGIIDAFSSDIRDLLRQQFDVLRDSSKNIFFDKTTTDITDFLTNGNFIINFVAQYSLDLILKNFPDYKQKLIELTELQEKLTKLNTDYNSLKPLIEQSATLIKELSEKYAQNISTQTDITTILDNAKKIEEQLEESKKNINEKIEDISTFYANKYSELKDSILNSDTGFESLINLSNEKYNIIYNFSDKATASLAALTLSVSEYEKILNNLSATNIAIQELFNKVNDPEQGIEKKYNAFNETKNKIDETKAKIEELYFKSTESFKIISDLEGKIGGIFKDASEKLKNINDLKKEANENLKAIKNIHDIVADTGMGLEFSKLARDSSNDFKKWSLNIILTASALFISILLLFILPFFICPGKFCEYTLKPDFLLRLTITSPIIFYLVFCTAQYKRAKDSYYKYSFKATLAFSIKNHINLLADNPRFQENVFAKPILDFAIKGLEKIYDEPYFDSAMEHRFKIQRDEIKYGNSDKGNEEKNTNPNV